MICDENFGFETNIAELLPPSQTTRPFEFIAKFERAHSSTLIRLRQLAEMFPCYIYMESPNVLVMYRAGIVEAMRKCDVTFRMENFERGLKHHGLCVIQSTHGQNVLKKWTVKI